MAVTHDMIAAKLGINRTTVTKALKGDPSIRELTRKKVVETATMMGYDFKQSQQNRREGKRFFVNAEVPFSFVDWETKEVRETGRGLLTNLSATGMLLKVNETTTSSVPIGNIGIKLEVGDDSPLGCVFLARVVRYTYMPNSELAAKFDKDVQLTQDQLIEIENQSFSQMDA
jgi:hypothetical protein